jgi:hypothetical protein
MKLPEVGQIVSYPSDRGNPPGTAKVQHVGSIVQKNIHGVPFVWVYLGNGYGVWPSHRLGFKIEDKT